MGCPSLTPEGFEIQGIPVDKTEPELFLVLYLSIRAYHKHEDML